MIKSKSKSEKRERRKKRIRAKIKGSASCPRLSVFKSNTSIYVQAIDDSFKKTLASFDSRSVKGKNLLAKAFSVGEEMGKKLVSSKVKKASFDRGGYAYTGSVKALADGVRSSGIKF